MMGFTVTVRRIALAAALALGAPAIAAAAAAEIDPLIRDQLASQGRADVFVKMDSEGNPVLAEFQKSRNDRLQYVYDTLTAHTERSQRGVRRLLNSAGYDYKVYWINNSIFIRDADQAMIDALANRHDVSYLRGNREVTLHLPKPGVAQPRRATLEWGVAMVGADTVWATGNTGQGIVVANIDTGVRYTHEAVAAQYRGNNGGGSFTHNYNWFDPSGVCGATPCDNNDHGTHTMGSMLGGDGFGPLVNDVGVAPGAKWIATKGCQSSSCSEANLIAAAQWIACPTETDGVSNPDCSKAPHIVNNSWGGGGGDNWYASYVGAWHAAGIIPVFSAGNSGSSCTSMGSPGDYANVIGVGGVDINDGLYDNSSKGPGSFRPLKPDFTAPGESVRSSTASSNSSYSVFSGTSMAAPHVVGTIALMKAANPAATIGQIYTALRNTADQTHPAPAGPDSCGGRNYDVYPNAIYGWGRIDAAAAVNAVAP